MPFSVSLLALADHQEDDIMAEEMRLIALDEASDLWFSNQGLLSPLEEVYAMGAKDLRARKKMEEIDEREVRRKIEHDAWLTQLEEALPRIAEVKKEAGQVDHGPGDRQDEKGEERRSAMFRLRTPEEWTAYLAQIESQLYAKMCTPTGTR